MRGYIRSVVILKIVLLLTSCVSWWSGAHEEKHKDLAGSKQLTTAVEEKSDSTGSESDSGPATAKNESQKAEVDKSSDVIVTDQLGLSQARMTERMAEIETELKIQREKIKLLERGLLTGIPPSELKASDDVSRRDKSSINGTMKDHGLDDLEMEQRMVKSDLTAPVLDQDLIDQTNLSKDSSYERSSDQAFQGAMIKAQKTFQGGDFNAALNEFAEISRKYGEIASAGAVRFWIGKCYAAMKDYGTAKTEFEAYLSTSPIGSNVADARLELARTLSKMGLKERASGEFKRVMQDFQGQEPAEIAVHELSALQGAL